MGRDHGDVRRQVSCRGGKEVCLGSVPHGSGAGKMG